MSEGSLSSAPEPRCRGAVVDWILGRWGALAKTGGWLPRTLNDQLEAALKATLIIGAVIAVAEYRDRRIDLKVARTLAYGERFEGADYRTSRARIRQALVAALAARKDQNAAADPALDAAYRSFGGTGVMPELSDVTGFLNGLEVCIQEDLCDERTSRRLFGPYASSFWRAFEPVVADQRAGETPDFALETEAFVHRLDRSDR